MKRALHATWDPVAAYCNQTQRDWLGNTDRTTTLRVKLDQYGELTEVTVAKSSGFSYLDNEALLAFEDAAPFLNPPARVIVNGIIAFTFGFTLQLGDPPMSAGACDVPNARRPLSEAQLLLSP